MFALTSATEFSCDAISIQFTHPGLGKTYNLLYWAGAVEDPDAIHTVEVQPAAEKAWNFLVYLDGDNNLEDQAIADLNEMERIGSTDAVNILALVDRTPSYNSTNGDWTSTRLYYITRDYDTGWINSTLIADYGELDMSDPDTLRDFIVHCQENFPAGRTVLTLWNHGGGVYPRTGAKSRKPQPLDPFGSSIGGARGLCWDDTTGSSPWNCLTTDEVASALADAYARTGQKIDIINMDVCLCQMLEVAWEWQGLTDYLVGSEENVPDTGNDYEAILARLTGNPGMATAAYARGLVDDYAALYAGEHTTYSCIDLGAPFASLRSSFSTFAHALNVTTDLAAAHLAAAFYGTHFSFYENIDLYGFAADLVSLTDDPAVASAADALMAAIEGAVYYRNTGEYANAANGIAILLADYSTWPRYSGSMQYCTLKLCKDTEWDEFIQDFAAGSEIDTLTATIDWDSGDCDLYVEDHGELYSISKGVSPNGVFSADSMNGGPESWTLNQPHAPGVYSFWVRSRNYVGNVYYNVVINGVNHSGTIAVTDNPFITYYLYGNYARNRIEVKAIDISTLPGFALPEK